MQNRRSAWSNASKTIKLLALTVAFATFVLGLLIVFLRGDNVITAIYYLFPFSGCLAVAMIHFNVGVAIVQREKLAWSSQSNMMYGFVFLFLSIVVVLSLGITLHTIDGLVSFPLAGIFLLAALGCFTWSIVVSKRNSIQS